MTNYDDKVRAASAALQRGEDANWELAELTHKTTLERGDVASQGGKVTMDQWCADVRAGAGRKFSNTTGYVYRRVWRTYGPSDPKDRPSWTDAETTIRGSLGGASVASSFNRILREGTPDQKTQALAQMVEDPEVLASLADKPAIIQPIISAGLQNPLVAHHVVRNSTTSVAINRAQLEQHAERQADIDRINASRERRDMEHTLDHPGRTNRQFVTSAADMVDKLTLNVSTLKAILEQETVSYLRPEDVGILARKLTYLRDQAQRCIDLLPGIRV